MEANSAHLVTIFSVCLNCVAAHPVEEITSHEDNSIFPVTAEMEVHYLWVMLLVI